MKKLHDKYYSNLNSRQRFVATWEAIGRSDDAELKRLQDTAPRFRCSGPDSSIKQSINGIIIAGLSVEVDMRGYALTFQMALRAGETDIAISSLKSMKTMDQMWCSLLKEIGLSDVAVKAVRPEHHPLVVHLLEVLKNYKPGPNQNLDDCFTKIRQMLPIL